jgi:hypothetical protein
MQIATENVEDAESLIAWLSRNGYAARSSPEPDAMGSAETISVLVATTATVRAALLVISEWIRAHRKQITVELPGSGRFEVKGTDDVADLIALLNSRSGDPER